MSRALATIREVKEIIEIPKADFLELAVIDGWQCVVKKGEMKTHDKICYFEIDSILPDGPEWAEFMRPRKFRVRTIKLRKTLSQGLALPLDALGLEDSVVGADVTQMLGVTKHDPQARKERQAYKSGRKTPAKWMLRWRVGRWMHQQIWPRAAGSFPEGIAKTDETRCQNIDTHAMYDGTLMAVSEKLDGQSVTIFYKRNEKVGFMARGQFGVCSRNIWYKNPTSNNWWNIAKKYNLQETLPQLCDVQERDLAIQGEICGPDIQKNTLKLDEKTLFVFNVFDITAGKYLCASEKAGVLKELKLHSVPVLDDVEFNTETDPLEMADGKSKICTKVLREGLVFRDKFDESKSFKAISNKWLLKHE